MAGMAGHMLVSKHHVYPNLLLRLPRSIVRGERVHPPAIDTMDTFLVWGGKGS